MSDIFWYLYTTNRSTEIEENLIYWIFINNQQLPTDNLTSGLELAIDIYTLTAASYLP